MDDLVAPHQSSRDSLSSRPMPGARKGMPGARAPSAKKLTRDAQRPQQSSAPAGKAAHGSPRAALEGKAALLLKLLKRKENAETRIRLADIYIQLEQYDRARSTLEACLQADAADPLCARRVLAPLLLQLGAHAEAKALLARFSTDKSATMLCSALLCTLSADVLDEDEAEAHFDAFRAANWRAVALVAAVSGGESPIPEGTVVELREQRLESLSKRPGAWPGAGGVQEAILLSEQFAGFAGNERASEDAWPGLAGSEVWLSQRLLQEPPPEKVSAVASDARKHVTLLEGLLEEILEELQHIVLEAEEEDEEEEGEEEGEEEEEEGEASGDAAEAEKDGGGDGDEAEGADDGKSTAGKKRPPFNDWLAAKRARLQEKLARCAPGEAVADEEGSDDDE